MPPSTNTRNSLLPPMPASTRRRRRRRNSDFPSAIVPSFRTVTSRADSPGAACPSGADGPLFPFFDDKGTALDTYNVVQGAHALSAADPPVVSLFPVGS